MSITLLFGGLQTTSMTASGGLVLGGTSPPTLLRYVAPSTSGVIVGGRANISIGIQVLTYYPSGGVLLGNPLTDKSYSRTYAAVGGTVFGGEFDQQKTAVISPADGALGGGHAVDDEEYSVIIGKGTDTLWQIGFYNFSVNQLIVSWPLAYVVGQRISGRKTGGTVLRHATIKTIEVSSSPLLELDSLDIESSTSNLTMLQSLCLCGNDLYVGGASGNASQSLVARLDASARWPLETVWVSGYTVMPATSAASTPQWSYATCICADANFIWFAGTFNDRSVLYSKGYIAKASAASAATTCWLVTSYNPIGGMFGVQIANGLYDMTLSDDGAWVYHSGSYGAYGVVGKIDSETGTVASTWPDNTAYKSICETTAFVLSGSNVYTVGLLRSGGADYYNQIRNEMPLSCPMPQSATWAITSSRASATQEEWWWSLDCDSSSGYSVGWYYINSETTIPMCGLLVGYSLSDGVSNYDILLTPNREALNIVQSGSYLYLGMRSINTIITGWSLGWVEIRYKYDGSLRGEEFEQTWDEVIWADDSSFLPSVEWVRTFGSDNVIVSESDSKTPYLSWADTVIASAETLTLVPLYHLIINEILQLSEAVPFSNIGPHWPPNGPDVVIVSDELRQNSVEWTDQSHVSTTWTLIQTNSSEE